MEPILELAHFNKVSMREEEGVGGIDVFIEKIRRTGLVGLLHGGISAEFGLTNMQTGLGTWRVEF